jgi:hypothetical protein
MLICPDVRSKGKKLAANFLMGNTLSRNIDRSARVCNFILIKHSLNLNTYVQDVRLLYKKCYDCRLQECEAV